MIIRIDLRTCAFFLVVSLITGCSSAPAPSSRVGMAAGMLSAVAQQEPSQGQQAKVGLIAPSNSSLSVSQKTNQQVMAALALHKDYKSVEDFRYTVGVEFQKGHITQEQVDSLLDDATFNSPSNDNRPVNSQPDTASQTIIQEHDNQPTERVVDEYATELCSSRLERYSSRLERKFGQFVGDPVCSNITWLGDDSMPDQDDGYPISEVFEALSNTRATHDIRRWGRLIRECDEDLTDSFNRYAKGSSVGGEKWIASTECWTHTPQAMNQYKQMHSGYKNEFHRISKMMKGVASNAINNANAKDAAENRAIHARSQQDFIRWKNNLQASSNQVLSDLSDVSERTNRAYQRPAQSTSQDNTNRAARNPAQRRTTDTELGGPSVAGSYLIKYFWNQCITLNADGTASFKIQTLKNWDDPHSGYAWNQKALKGSWEPIQGQEGWVSVGAKGIHRKPNSNETKEAAKSRNLNTNGGDRVSKVSSCP